MTNNVYQAPESDLTSGDVAGQAILASRWARLGASIIDGIIMLVIVAPIQYLTGAYDNLSEDVGMFDNIGYAFIMGLVGIVVYALINGKLLLTEGQTWGKKMLGTQIVDEQSYEKASKNQILKRYGTYFACSIVPVIGGILSLINILFVFSSRKQCLHDLAGKTVVVYKIEKN